MNFTKNQKEYLKQYVHELTPTLAGNFLFYCIPFRKKVVLKNMHDVFKEVLSSDDILKLAKSFYSHVATSLKENIFLRFMSMEQIKKKAEIIGAEYMYELLDSPIKGAILITGHFGNWEFAPIAGILNFTEFQGRFYFVRKYISTKWVERLLFKRYYQAGLNVIPKKIL